LVAITDDAVQLNLNAWVLFFAQFVMCSNMNSTIFFTNLPSTTPISRPNLPCNRH